MGVSKEAISNFLIGNRFHVKLRILSLLFEYFYLNKDWGCVILREIDFLLKICWSLPCLHPSWKVRFVLMIMEVYFESCLIHLLHFYPMIFASVICFERFVRTLIILIVIIIFLCSLGSANVHVLLLQAFHFFVFRSFLATRVKQRVVKASVSSFARSLLRRSKTRFS